MSRILASGVILIISVVTVSANFDFCNQTFTELQDLNGSQDSMAAAAYAKATLRLPEVAPAHHGLPVYCWFRFRAEDGHYVQVEVKEVRAGMYDDEAKDCSSGYLRISDEQSCSTDPQWLPPTTLCGHYTSSEVMVKRLTRSPVAYVEFKLDHGEKTKGYEFDITFLDKADNLLYGDLQRTDGKIEHTKCDWLVPVDQCIGWCNVISPGYPGIYPPETRCRYTFTNFDDGRVELRLGGRGFMGVFDMKEDPECQEDYVAVYDGASTLQPLIGKYCGQEGYHLISTGPSLLLIFQSGPGGPPWDYSGFKIEATNRWKNEHEGGVKVEDSHCDWTFRSRDGKDGNIHAPDHMSHRGTLCTFRFIGTYNERVTIKVVVSRNLDPDCSETVTIVDGDVEANNTQDTICADRLKPRQAFGFNTTGCSASVQYYRRDFQVSDTYPVWVHYTFWRDPNVTLSNRIPRGSDCGEAAQFLAEPVIQGDATHNYVTMTSLLGLMTSLWALHVLTEFG